MKDDTNICPVQKMLFYSMISMYIKASQEVDNGIYDPIEKAILDIQKKYTIIKNNHER